MNITKYGVKGTKLKKMISIDDMKYLQKKITGRSVYKNFSQTYFRKPKHKNMWDQNYI